MPRLDIYIHFPFCRDRCTYCDFVTVDVAEHQKTFRRYLDYLCREITLSAAQQTESNQSASSLYFGGGTPSLMSPVELSRVVSLIRQFWPLTDDAEISIECNPHSLDEEKLSLYRETGVNRINLGIQTFNDDLLRQLNRLHSAEDALYMVRLIRSAGFSNVGIDLIFGLPNQGEDSWVTDIWQAVRLSPEHLSVYNLMLDGDTPLRRQVHEGSTRLPDEETQRSMFTTAMEVLTGEGYRHYEISNYAKPGFECRHNLTYWTGEPYRAFGLGAHSFAGTRRRWNVKEMSRYQSMIDAGCLPVEGWEDLDAGQQWLELIMLSLRTDRGIHLPSAARLSARQTDSLVHRAHNMDPSWFLFEEDYLKVSPSGKIVMDRIIRALA